MGKRLCKYDTNPSRGVCKCWCEITGCDSLLAVTRGTPHKSKEMKILFDKTIFLNCVWMFVKTKERGIVYLSRHCSIICPMLIQHELFFSFYFFTVIGNLFFASRPGTG